MLKNRMIPCLFLRNGVLVQSRGFQRYQMRSIVTTSGESMNSFISTSARVSTRD